MRKCFASTKLSVACVIGFAIALLLPSINAGLMADDTWHALWVSGLEHNHAQSALSLFGLFSFINPASEVYQGLLTTAAIPWWTVADLKVNFWRPVAELSHLDYRYFLDQPKLLHLHSLLWYALQLCLLAAYYQRLFAKKMVWLFALVFFVSEPFHAVAVSWLANRNIIIAAVFSLASLILHIDYRRLDSLWRLWLSLLCFLLALLSAEISVSVLGFIIAYTLFMDKRPRAYRVAVPYIVLAVMWFISYKALGYGVSGSAAMYIDPVTRPYDFIAQYAQRVPLVLALQLTIYPKLSPAIFTPAVLISLGSAIFALWLVLALRLKSRVLGFLCGAFLFSILPVASALLHERNFVFVSMALSPLLALLLEFLWRNKSWLNKSVFGSLVLLRMVLTAALVPIACLYMIFMVNNPINNTIQSLPELRAQDHVLLLGAPTLHSSFIYPTRQLAGKIKPLSMHTIFTDQCDCSIEKLAANRWLIRAEQGILAGEDFFLRDLQLEPLEVGDKYTLAEAELSVLAVNPQGNPTQLGLIINEEKLGQYQLLHWHKNRFQPLAAPQSNLVDHR